MSQPHAMPANAPGRSSQLPPFSCSVTPGFAERLAQLNCTLAIST